MNQILDGSIAWRLRVIPDEASLNSQEGTEFFFDERTNMAKLKKELEFLLETKVRLNPLSSAEIERRLEKHYPKGVPKNESSETGVNQTQIFSYQNLDLDSIESLIADAVSLNASDIHIERSELKGRIRYRIDGKLILRKIISAAEYPGLVNRIKVKSNTSISEKRIPQDGRCLVICNESKYDLRVSVMPSVYSEMIVIRILGNSKKAPELNKIGLSVMQSALLKNSLKKLQGLILISGPTGSGKTSTLYACMEELNSLDRNIVSIEDPVELTLEGINQVQVRSEVGLSFSSALRAFLRQDPDVIMIGEIRDQETAALAVRASMTGHLVISTIHTNSAWETLSRLNDLGIPPFLLASSLTLSVAQRLVRKLCHSCSNEINGFNESQCSMRMQGSGCRNCNHTGYHGRIGCFEMIEITTELKNKIAKGEITDSDKPENYVPLTRSVNELVLSGLTSDEEALPIRLSFDEAD